MKSNILILSLSATLLPLDLFGESPHDYSVALDISPAIGGSSSPLSNSGGLKFGFGFAPILGVDAKFSERGPFQAPLSPQALGGGQNYNYDNGFVRLDSTGNAGGLTSNWGYEDPAQYNPFGGGTIAYSITNQIANGNTTDSDDLSSGFEFFGYYDIGDLPTLTLGGGSARWGLKATLHYANISISNSSTQTADFHRVTDTFGLNGVVPPLAPFSGSFNGPGPLISDTPTRSTTSILNGTTVTRSRDLDVNVLALTVGPYLELPVSSRFSVNLEGGLSLALISGDYNFGSATTNPVSGTTTLSGKESATSILPGLSVGFNAFYQINDSWSAYAGAKYQYFSDFKIDDSSSEAKLDFGKSFVLSLGATWRY